MKKILRYLTPIVLLFGVLTGCDKENPATFKDKDRIYFYHYDTVPAIHVQIDSASFSMKGVDYDADRVTVYITAQLLGNESPVDRPITIKQINSDEKGAAVPGEHYVPFETSNIYLPAGKSSVGVPVTLIRNEYLLDNEATLEMEVVPNEYFDTGLPDFLTFKLKFTDMYTKPTVWDMNWKGRFGTWGPVKFEFLIRNVTGNIDWNDGSPINSQLANYWAKLAREKLEEYNNDPANDPNRPLKERDEEKTVVSFDK